MSKVKEFIAACRLGDISITRNGVNTNTVPSAEGAVSGKWNFSISWYSSEGRRDLHVNGKCIDLSSIDGKRVFDALKSAVLKKAYVSPEDAL